MQNQKFKIIILYVAGAMLIFLALLFAGIGLTYDITWHQKDAAAGSQSEQIVSILDDMFENFTEAPDSSISIEEINKQISEIENVEAVFSSEKETEEIDLYSLIPDEMHYEEIDGNRYLGTILIPSLELQLPIILLEEEWLPEKMDIAPCVYDGRLKTHDLIIMAHNYAAHFRGILNMQAGQEVIIKTVDGMQYTYLVTAVDVMNRKEREKLYEGNWDLTLFTCVPSSYNRCAVRCQLISVEKP